MSTPNCPFYGRAYYGASSPKATPAFVLLETGGNQCALRGDAHAPCFMVAPPYMQVEWRDCPLLKDITIKLTG